MQDPKSVERKYAEFFDLYLAEFHHDVRVYLELAGKYPGPVLEVGCGPGRVLLKLAEAGHRVHGIDTCRPMLEIARRKVHAHQELVSLADFDLRSGPLQDRFGIVLVSLFAFNTLIDIEEQRLFLRHLTRSIGSEALVVFDLFCPMSLARPDDAEEWREIARESGGRRIQVRDKREMLTPLLERRTQRFQVDGSAPADMVTHRRYITPQQAASLLDEAGFENIRWLPRYDLSAAAEVDADSRPEGPFLVLAER